MLPIGNARGEARIEREVPQSPIEVDGDERPKIDLGLQQEDAGEPSCTWPAMMALNVTPSLLNVP